MSDTEFPHPSAPTIATDPLLFQSPTSSNMKTSQHHPKTAKRRAEVSGLNGPQQQVTLDDDSDDDDDEEEQEGSDDDKGSSHISIFCLKNGDADSIGANPDDEDGLDDDDICPICEDECTCGGNDSSLMPLFSQISSKQHEPVAVDKGNMKKKKPAKQTVTKRKPKAKKKKAPAKVKASQVHPSLYEVNSTVIRGRDKKRSLSGKQGRLPSSIPEPLSSKDEDEDEFINITDVTSDATSHGGDFPSETEFDRLTTTSHDDTGMSSGKEIWGEEENIKHEEESYLTHLQESDLSSTSNLSDLDDYDDMNVAPRARHHRQRRYPRAHIVNDDSGDESDSESTDNESSGSGHEVGRYVRVRKRRQRRRRLAMDLSDNGSSSSESDEELTFREARTADEKALEAYAESGDEREEALLDMHLDQLRAVRNVIQDCSSPSPLLNHTIACTSDDNDIPDLDRQITFNYQSDSSQDNNDSDLSNDLMEGWATDTRRRWNRNQDEDDSDASSSAFSESRMNKVRLRDDDDDDNQGVYDSDDSYEQFYTRNAFMAIDSDYDDYDGGMLTHPSEFDLDGASLALGVAMSMEQQGYSKEDAATAAAAAAAAAASYPGRTKAVNCGDGVGDEDDSGANGGGVEVSTHASTTTITASMNANGEADPIDGIVSIKSSSSNNNASSRVASGAHTPFAGSSRWNMAAAAAAAAAYLDGSQQAALSYVLPKDLNEARSPNVSLPTVVETEEAATSPDTEDSPDADSKVDTSSTNNVNGKKSFLSSHLPNSSFYKPLSSICSPAGPEEGANEPSSTAPVGSAFKPAENSQPAAISLSEVNAALVALTDEQQNGNVLSSVTPIDLRHLSRSPVGYNMDIGSDLKRKASDTDLLSSTATDDKRLRGERLDGDGSKSAFGIASPFDMSALFSGNGSLSASINSAPAGIDSFGGNFGNGTTPQPIPPVLSLGAGTPMGNVTPVRRGSRSNILDGEDDGWLMSMDQLVDTDALLIESPPPSPEDGVHPQPAAAAMSSVNRWDRIPVNIFRRSRALASSASRRRDLMNCAQDDMVGNVSMLALTAIKSSRQRRSLINSTLLTQHTLRAAESMHHLQGTKGKRNSTPRHTRDGNTHSQQNDVSELWNQLLASAAPPPPPPPPTPLSSRSNTMAPESSPINRRKSAESAVTQTSSNDAAISSVSSDREAGKAGSKNESEECVYAFDWLESEEDLALFAMPELSATSTSTQPEQQHQQPNMTMILASSSSGANLNTESV